MAAGLDTSAVKRGDVVMGEGGGAGAWKNNSLLTLETKLEHQQAKKVGLGQLSNTT